MSKRANYLATAATIVLLVLVAGGLVAKAHFWPRAQVKYYADINACAECDKDKEGGPDLGWAILAGWLLSK